MRATRYLGRAARLALGVVVTLASLPASAADAPVADAAEQGDAAQVGELLGSGAEVDAVQADGMTALLWAAFHDDFETARALVAAGASAKVSNRYGMSPLALACRNGNAPLVKLLLDAGADATAKFPGGETPLMIAARTGLPEPVKALVDAGADVDAAEHQGQTALMWAAAEGHSEVVEVLLAHGADLRATLKSGLNPLLLAARGGHVEAVRVILGAGADVNGATEPERRNPRLARPGTAALMLTIENGHFELALELIDHGADLNDERSGFTPLHAVTWVRKTARGEDDDGTPPPDGSGRIRSLEFVRELVKRGADVNARLEEGSGGGGRLHTKGATPFLLAAKGSDLPLLKVLLELGADPTIPNVENCPPLLATAGIGVTAPGEEPGTEAEALETLAFLLELGADINAVDDNRETVMHGAAYKCMPSLVRFFDSRGADVSVWNHKNRGGWTPLLIAQGYRPGNFRPIQDNIEAISQVMLARGVTPPPAPSAE